jgi:undecaprenyl-diphosphatase
MEVINKIILAIIQGITEMLPVSSSGHLLLASEVLHFELDLSFLTLLHLMTAFAIFCGFWREIKSIFNSEKKYFLITILLLSSIPSGIIGVLFYTNIEKLHNNTTLILLNLVFIGILMILIDNFFSKKESIKKLGEIKSKNALFVALMQAVAFLPGISRSGITIISGIATGMNKKTAIAFSFLIAIPILTLGFFFEFANNPENIHLIFKPENILAGLAAFIFGYFSILILKSLTNTPFLTIFGIYRILLGIVILFSLAI